MNRSICPIRTAIVAAVAIFLAVPSSSQAQVVLLSGTSADEYAQLTTFFTTNFTNVTSVRAGDYSNFSAAATQEALMGTGAFAGQGAANFVVIGRTLASAGYQNVSAGYNALAIPVVNFTSYTARDAGNRLGWHVGSAFIDKSTVGEETTITAAGEALFGIGTRNWHESAGDTFNGTGTAGADVGGGQVLATLAGDILVASWAAGTAPGNQTAAGVSTFGGQRLLFNLDNDAVIVGDTVKAFNSLTAGGQSALIRALGTVGFVAVPEPSSMLVVSLVGLAGMSRRRR